MWLKSTKPAKRVELFAFVVSFTMFKKEFELYEILCLSRFTYVCQCQVTCVQILLVLVLVFYVILSPIFLHLKTGRIRDHNPNCLIILGYDQNNWTCQYSMCIGCHFMSFDCVGFSPLIFHCFRKNTHIHRVNFTGSDRGTG